LEGRWDGCLSRCLSASRSSTCIRRRSRRACGYLTAKGSARRIWLSSLRPLRGLLALADWLRGYGVTHVAMEATGVYWKPIWAVLEDAFELMLVKAT
jgi:transposase